MGLCYSDLSCLDAGLPVIQLYIPISELIMKIEWTESHFHAETAVTSITFNLC